MKQELQELHLVIKLETKWEQVARFVGLYTKTLACLQWKKGLFLRTKLSV